MSNALENQPALLRESLGQRALDLLARTLDLGDERNEERVLEMARASLSAQSVALPSFFGVSERSIKGAQRLLSEADFELDALRRPLYALAWSEVTRRGLTRVVAAFDPTILDFSGHKKKKDRIEGLGDGHGKGYIWNNLALVDPATGSFLGVAHQTLVSASGPDDREDVDYVEGVAEHKKEALRTEMELNHKNEFLCQTRQLQQMPPGVEVTFVADREFDDGLVLRELSAHPHTSFVIRGNGSRHVQIHKPDWLPASEVPTPQQTYRWQMRGIDRDADAVDVPTAAIVKHLPLTPLRDLPLDPRGRVCTSGAPARIARLGVGAIPIRLVNRSTRAIHAGIKEAPCWLNLVVVRELDPPPGDSICWLLLTDLPTDSPAQLERIVDCYVARWRIEEFFRTTKDVMQLEETRLDDPTALARLLFFVTFRAMCLDILRETAGLRAGQPPTDEQRQKLREGARQVDQIEHLAPPARRQALSGLSSRQFVWMLLGKIAALGGWSAKRGKHLGNYILVKGLDLFLHDLSMGHFRWLVTTPGKDVG